MPVPNRISIKLPVQTPADFALTDLIAVFHRWIRDNALDGVLVDVADYKHVADGPGIMLIGYAGDFSFDLADNQPGLRYTMKRGWSDATFAGRLRAAWQMTLRAASLLTAESGLTVDVQSVEIGLLDRLNTPNTADVYGVLAADVQQVAAELVGPALTISRLQNDARRPLTIHVQAANPPRLVTAPAGTEVAA